MGIFNEGPPSFKDMENRFFFAKRVLYPILS